MTSGASPQDTTPGAWETTLEYWRSLHEVIDVEPHLDAYGALYGELAALGIAKGQPFAPDERMTQILEQAARIANRSIGAGSLYWLGLRDRGGACLDGARTYRLSVPQPVPGKLFWSITVHDAETRSQIATDQNQAALRSLFELADAGGDAPVDLWFGPAAPEVPRAGGSRPFPAGA